MPTNKVNEDLIKIREEINLVDRKLISVLATRFRLTDTAHIIKRLHGCDNMLDQSRWSEVIDNIVRIAEDIGLDKSIAVRLYDVIHEEANKR